MATPPKKPTDTDAKAPEASATPPRADVTPTPPKAPATGGKK